MKENTVWMENCYENFQGYVAEGNLAMARAAIDDMRDFSPEAAKNMEVELNNTPVRQFISVSPIQRHDL